MVLSLNLEFFHPKKIEWKRPKKFYMSQRERQNRTRADAHGIFQLWWGNGKLQFSWRKS